jgi:hypothetical protein
MPEGEREGILQAGQKILKLDVFRIQLGRAAGAKKIAPHHGCFKDPISTS